ncbi:MAG: hypothetical protein JW395_2183 [Nitrospira sp.]|nr:hypothetical protein [Nitrospira sp.]
MTPQTPSDAGLPIVLGPRVSFSDLLPPNPWAIELAYQCIRMHEHALKEQQASKSDDDSKKARQIIAEAYAMLDRLMTKCDLVGPRRERAFAYWERGLQTDAVEAVHYGFAERIRTDEDGRQVLLETLKFYLQDPGYQSDQRLSLYGGAALCVHLAKLASLDRNQILRDALGSLAETTAAVEASSTTSAKEQTVIQVAERAAPTRDCMDQNGGLQEESAAYAKSQPSEPAELNDGTVIQDKVTGPQRKRRYRLRRYRKELLFLRPVTSNILQELDKRVPKDVGKVREIICFAIGEGSEHLVIVTFNYDRTCNVVNLGYGPGMYDVERGSHNIDLHWLKMLIARRRTKRRNQDGNNLAAQLLIRFIVHINNTLDPEMGPYLQFKDAWLVAGPRLTLEPKHSIKRILKRRLSTIICTDPDVPSNSTYTVSVHFPNDRLLANYRDLRRHLLEGGDLEYSYQGVFTADAALLTERFVALAWLVFTELQYENLFVTDDVFAARTMERSYMIGSPDDTSRLCGWSGDTCSWEISCRIPSTRNRKRSIVRLRKWIKHSLAVFKRSELEPALWDLNWSINRDKRDEMRRVKLLPWAKRRWGTSDRELVVSLEAKLSGDDGNYTRLCEETVVEHQKFYDLARSFAPAIRH